MITKRKRNADRLKALSCQLKSASPSAPKIKKVEQIVVAVVGQIKKVVANEDE